jgi:hypothetical protein
VLWIIARDGIPDQAAEYLPDAALAVERMGVAYPDSELTVYGIDNSGELISFVGTREG